MSDTAIPQPVLFHAGRFDRGLLRRAMVMRGITIYQLVERTGLSRSTIQEARAGRPIADATAIAILKVLERADPMVVRV